MRFIVRPGEAHDRVQVGGKAGSLAALHQADLPIPAWFVLTPDAFDPSLTPEQRSALRTPDDIAAALADLHPAPEVRAALDRALAELCPQGELVAVRSSAPDEDGQEHSFAGQLDSILRVAPRDVPDAVARVWRSAFSRRILAYRREHGLAPLPSPTAVLIQRMVDAEASGVAFSTDPVAPRRGMAVVAAVHGLGDRLVSGACDADTYHVDLDGRIDARSIETTGAARAGALAGGDAQTAPERATEAPLLDDQVRAVAALARRAEEHFGCPQDVEWAIAEGVLYLLQSRPITALPPSDGSHVVYGLWDNSNISESYGGMTTPLTFSFARFAYEEVYRQFFRLMGVSDATIAAHANAFRNMLGFVRGRVYYNLLNWYRLLALLPGFTVNRTFMEQMMGVRESLPDSVAAELVRATWRNRLSDSLRLLRLVGSLAINYALLPRQIRRFYLRLDRALVADPAELRRMPADRLVSYYRELERQLLTCWDAPLVNDFFAMIFYGLLRKLTLRWCDDAEGSLQNDLLCGEGGMISTEPAARVRAMARLARCDPEVVTLLCTGPADAILPALKQRPELRTQFEAYVAKFGDRCLEELKLESPTLRDDPLSLLRAVGHLAGLDESIDTAGANSEARSLAERRVRARLGRRPLRGAVFAWVLRNARARVRDRENLRFERTRVFGAVRLIVVELGRRFQSLGLLHDPRDIFYLQMEEVLGFVEGTASCTDLKGLVEVRRAELARYRAMEAPADRFQTRGVVYVGNSFRSEREDKDLGEGRRQGIGCSPGVVRGRVRIVTDPVNARLQPGDILVAERTDPGWVLLFPSAAGLLVERGSLLSHSAIVAREMGIPTIVSLPGLLRWLKDGDWVEFDGATGLVTKLSAPREVVASA